MFKEITFLMQEFKMPILLYKKGYKKKRRSLRREREDCIKIKKPWKLLQGFSYFFS